MVIAFYPEASSEVPHSQEWVMVHLTVYPSLYQELMMIHPITDHRSFGVSGTGGDITLVGPLPTREQSDLNSLCFTGVAGLDGP